ncbi:MAG: flagellar biosynthetic protein FliO [Selenomonadaceae bacterium]|nr:flagellar biosynthetic protein FliO [Selenomonadaceae bacterium]
MNWGRMLFLLGVALLLIWPDSGFAAPEGSASSGYLAGYEEAEPRPAPISVFSTVAYVLSLLAVFAFVLLLAYFATRFLGKQLNQHRLGNGKILTHLPLGPKQSVCVVELADRVLVLGVTEGSVNLLTEITDPEEIEELHRQNMIRPDSDEGIFAKEFGVLTSLAQKVDSFRK